MSKFILITSVLSVMLLSGCQDKVVQKSTPPPPLPIKTVDVKKGKYPIWVQYTGKTKASSEQQIRARVSGRLEKIFFKDGQHVKKERSSFLSSRHSI